MKDRLSLCSVNGCISHLQRSLSTPMTLARSLAVNVPRLRIVNPMARCVFGRVLKGGTPVIDIAFDREQFGTAIDCVDVQCAAWTAIRKYLDKHNSSSGEGDDSQAEFHFNAFYMLNQLPHPPPRVCVFTIRYVVKDGFSSIRSNGVVNFARYCTVCTSMYTALF